jgi:hypothetical protein
MDARAGGASWPGKAKSTRERAPLHIRERILRGLFPGCSFLGEKDITPATAVARGLTRAVWRRLHTLWWRR